MCVRAVLAPREVSQLGTGEEQREQSGVTLQLLRKERKQTTQTRGMPGAGPWAGQEERWILMEI